MTNFLVTKNLEGKKIVLNIDRIDAIKTSTYGDNSAWVTVGHESYHLPEKEYQFLLSILSTSQLFNLWENHQ